MSRSALLAGVFVVVALAALPTVSADEVLDWNTAALNAIRRNRTPPPIASRALAILHAAIYDAVNGIVRNREPYIVNGQALRTASVKAAVATSAHMVLSTLFPADATTFQLLSTSQLGGIRMTSHKSIGMQWGNSVATQILAARAADGATANVSVPSATMPGDWVPTPPAFAPYLLPQWARLKPFVMNSSSQFRTPAPPAVNSSLYTAMFNEVKALGAAVGSTRTADQSQIATFWADGAGTETPPGHWNSIARAVSVARGLSLRRNARLFALLNLAMADAAITAWDAKLLYCNWRPVTAIRNAASDGNPNTDADPAWSSYIGTPPFPDHVSGHSTFSGAGSTVLERFFRTDSVSFTTGSDAMPGVFRSFTSFSAAATEAMNSRLFGGIHFRAANEDGLVAGRKIGELAFSTLLRRRGARTDDDEDRDERRVIRG